jgi:Ran GTPase-activating protein (RanGAP) involved in mRNA processing and transport
MVNLSPKQASSCKLKKLKLEDNSLGDKLTIQLLDSLRINMSLNHLNLSNNQINCGEDIAKLLTSDCPIKILELHWNKIDSLNGSKIIDALDYSDSNLDVLDLGWNNIGFQSNIAMQIFEEKLPNINVFHMDLSNNGISFDGCMMISRGLKRNQTQVGIHTAGNALLIDSKGNIYDKMKLREDGELFDKSD